jgi:hypothetical protein
MYKSKLIQLLQVLNSEEKEALKKWIQSPIHTQHKKSIELLSILVNKRKLTPKNTTKEVIFKQLFSDEIYQPQKLRYIMSYCSKILEDFIEFFVQQNDPFSQKKNLIQYLDSHHLTKYANQHLEKLKKVQEQQLIRNQAYFQQQYQLEQIIFDRQNITKRSDNTNLQAVLDNQYITFVLDTLYYACETINHQQLYKSTYNIPLLDTILQNIKAGQYHEIPAIQLYYHSYMTLSAKNAEEHFNILRTLLTENYGTLPHKEIKNLYLLALNYCIKQLNSGVEKYVQIAFELLQYGLTYNILIEFGKLNHFTYKNIVSIALRLNEFEWVTNFIKVYTPKIDVEYQANYKLFAQSKLLFAQQKYDDCMQLLAQVEFDDLFLNMNAKSMLLKIYYEQGYWEALDALIVSFKRFLQRKSIVSYQRTIYTNMLFFTEKLITLNKFNKEEKEKLRTEIEQTTPLTEKPWLFAQLDKL